MGCVKKFGSLHFTTVQVKDYVQQSVNDLLRLRQNVSIWRIVMKRADFRFSEADLRLGRADFSLGRAEQRSATWRQEEHVKAEL